MLVNITLVYNGLQGRVLVIPTVIHFAPLLRAQLLGLWRDCAMRLWTMIFGCHHVMDRSSITSVFDGPSVAVIIVGTISD